MSEGVNVMSGGPLVWDVAALVRGVADALAARFAAVAVRGEMSSFSRAASGHCYFVLKAADGSASLRCAMFRRAATLLDFPPRDGMGVEVRGRLAVYEPRGELQLIVEAMRRDGEGVLMEQFLRLKARLEGEGLFEATRKRPVALFPRRVGVVTSTSAAALHDVLTTLARRAPHVEVIVYPASVQGAEAGAQLAQAVRLAALRREVDTLLVCRGGGSMADLWAFNDESLVRALVTAPMPVISGIGHETDFTLCDFVADVRAPTPTAAAERAAAARDDCRAQLGQTLARLRRRVHDRLERDAQHLDHLAARTRRPAAVLNHHAQRLQQLALRLAIVPGARTERERARWQHVHDRFVGAMGRQRLMLDQSLQQRAQRLVALDPARILSRGYAWVTDDGGRPLLSAQGIRAGQSIVAVLSDGQVRATVSSVESAAPLAAPRMSE